MRRGATRGHERAKVGRCDRGDRCVGGLFTNVQSHRFDPGARAVLGFAWCEAREHVGRMGASERMCVLHAAW
eukprot:5587593-Prymnesium_polylepis.1